MIPFLLLGAGLLGAHEYSKRKRAKEVDEVQTDQSAPPGPVMGCGDALPPPAKVPPPTKGNVAIGGKTMPTPSTSVSKERASTRGATAFRNSVTVDSAQNSASQPVAESAVAETWDIFQNKDGAKAAEGEVKTSTTRPENAKQGDTWVDPQFGGTYVYSNGEWIFSSF